MKSLLEERLHQLNWSHTASQLNDLVENASTHNVSYFEFYTLSFPENGNT